MKVTLIRIEERFAIFYNDMVGEIRWPLDTLPNEIRIGDMVTLSLIDEETKYDRMRRLLEELIN